MIKKEIEIGGRTLTVETGKVAKQANGAVIVTYGETVVLVTATAAQEPAKVDFLPLTVEYQERFYAVGRIPGSFFRREIGRPTEKETLTCRFIDRPLRPLFVDGYCNETQIIATVLSMDQENEPDLLAMIGASTALTISEIPFLGPIAGVRVGYINGEYVLNPSREQLVESRLNLIVAGTRDSVVMVEGGSDSLSEQEILEGIFFGHEQLQPIIAMQIELRKEIGKPKLEVAPPVVDEQLRQRIEALAGDGLAEAIKTPEKLLRNERLRILQKEVMAALKEENAELDEPAAKALFKEFNKKMMRDRIVVEKIRIDGRKMDEVRPIATEVSYLPRVHGSSLFTRGETQCIATATLGSGEDEQRVESLYGMSFNQFMLHYNFPPYCVGEVRFLRGPSRRDIGHGALATRALQAVLPDNEQFPYTIRIVSEVTESNGSSSMATVCGGSLALMDAGVPIKRPVSGVAMGLIKENDDIIILTDILGDEDHLGDMDFKVAGSEDGITALQMDIKIAGVSRDIMSRALEQAKAGRLHILKEMGKVISLPRAEISEYAPKVTTLMISPDKIRDIIGPGGKMIKALTAEFDVKIDVEDSGKITIFAPSSEASANVMLKIREITAEAEEGKIYTGKVQKIVDFGAFVEILPGVDGLVHISELDNHRVEKVTDVLSEGDIVTVKVLNIDGRGKIRLSRKAVLAEGND